MHVHEDPLLYCEHHLAHLGTRPEGGHRGECGASCPIDRGSRRRRSRCPARGDIEVYDSDSSLDAFHSRVAPSSRCSAAKRPRHQFLGLQFTHNAGQNSICNQPTLPRGENSTTANRSFWSLHQCAPGTPGFRLFRLRGSHRGGGGGAL